MDTKEKETITVQTIINAPIEKVWKLWTSPQDITHWNNASDEWHTHGQKMICAQAENLFCEWKRKTAVWVLISVEFMIP